MRVTLIVLLPVGRRAKQGAAANGGGGEISNEFCTVMDLVSTILEPAGVRHPGAEYAGEKIAPLLEKSMVAYLADGAPVHAADECPGGRLPAAARSGRAGTRSPTSPRQEAPQKRELFDLEDDPGETRGLSEQLPGIMKEVLQHWEIYKADVGVVGLAGELNQVPLVVDEFEDTGKWTRFLGGILAS